ncbi:CACYBP [Bugula neritina]|uniref:CACYBP n=1 Tax=Bugula neritina TaxID=10212 RepID=A0A7J7KGT4_BUGNE|nr:CACYBP [Bugula neritina]
MRMATLEIKKDQEELKRLLQLASRENVKNILLGHIEQLQKSVDEDESKNVNSSTSAPSTETKAATSPNKPTKLPLQKISSYAWDQSDSYVKVYASNLSGVQQVPSDNVSCQFNTRGFNLFVSGLNGKDHQLQIVSLYGNIVPEESKIKIKTDCILVMLKKASKESGKV